MYYIVIQINSNWFDTLRTLTKQSIIDYEIVNIWEIRKENVTGLGREVGLGQNLVSDFVIWSNWSKQSAVWNIYRLLYM